MIKVICGSALFAAAIISSKLTSLIFPSMPRSVMIEIAKHGIFICRATITSGIVDIPTASAPIMRRNLYSAGVSRLGPVTLA